MTRHFPRVRPRNDAPRHVSADFDFFTLRIIAARQVELQAKALLNAEDPFDRAKLFTYPTASPFLMRDARAKLPAAVHRFISKSKPASTRTYSDPRVTLTSSISFILPTPSPCTSATSFPRP
jgi:hypothetical protein